MFGMSLTEIAVILIVGLVILGPEKLPEMMRTVGKVLREVRKAGNLLRDTIMLEEQEFNRKNTTTPAYQQPTAALDHADSYDDYSHDDYAHDHYADDELHLHHGLHEYAPMDPPTRFEIVIHEQRSDELEGTQVELAPVRASKKAASVDDAWYEHMSEDDDASLEDDHPCRRDVPLHMQLEDAGHDMRAW